MFRRGSNCDSQCLECRLLSAPKARATHLVRCVVGNSQFILDRHLDHGLFANATCRKVVFNAYARGEVRDRSKIGTREEEPGTLRLGYIGRLSEEKGIRLLLDAIAMLPRDGWSLTIAGTGEEEYVSAVRASSGHNVTYLGFVDPEAFFEKVDVVVLPSLWHEPLSRAIFEGYAHGKPVLASNRGGSPEVVDEGSTGYLFVPEQGPQALADLLTRVIDDPEHVRSMRAACLEKAKSFLPEVTVDAYVKTYEETLSERRTLP